jgi:transcriptional regulator with XRE-family HTH domain
MYESGRRTPDLETLTRLAEYFTVSLDYLVRESGPAPPEPLPPDIREFVAREANRPYLDLARELAEEGIRPDEVRELSRFIRRLSRKR